MKTISLWLIVATSCITCGCSVQSAVRKGVETIYKTSVDERSIRHIINDKKLSGLIMAELIKDDMTNVLDVTAECFFGYPFVVGECNNLEEAQRIMDIAERITGKQPIPFLMKKGNEEKCNPVLNLKISTEVKARLLADKKIFATNVIVKSVQCQAVLLGVLGSKEAILSAIEHSEKVEGVKKVNSFLVSTDTGRSWDSVFKAMGKSASDSTDIEISGTDDTQKERDKNNLMDSKNSAPDVSADHNQPEPLPHDNTVTPVPVIVDPASP